MAYPGCTLRQYGAESVNFRNFRQSYKFFDDSSISFLEMLKRALYGRLKGHFKERSLYKKRRKISVKLQIIMHCHYSPLHQRPKNTHHFWCVLGTSSRFQMYETNARFCCFIKSLEFKNSKIQKFKNSKIQKFKNKTSKNHRITKT